MALIDEIEELLDRKLDEKLDVRFAEQEKRLEEKLEEKLETKFKKYELKFDNKLGAFMEHMDDKFISLAEAVQTTLEIVSQQPKREELDDFKADVKTIRSAVTATNQDLRKLVHA